MSSIPNQMTLNMWVIPSQIYKYLYLKKVVRSELNYSHGRMKFD